MPCQISLTNASRRADSNAVLRQIDHVALEPTHDVAFRPDGANLIQRFSCTARSRTNTDCCASSIIWNSARGSTELELQIRVYILHQQIVKLTAGVVDPRIEQLEISSERIRLLRIKAGNRGHLARRVLAFAQQSRRRGFWRHEDKDLPHPTQIVKFAFAIATTCRLCDGVEARQARDRRREIHIHASLDELRADDARGLSGFQSSLDIRRSTSERCAPHISAERWIVPSGMSLKRSWQSRRVFTTQSTCSCGWSSAAISSHRLRLFQIGRQVNFSAFQMLVEFHLGGMISVGFSSFGKRGLRGRGEHHRDADSASQAGSSRPRMA